MSVLVINVDYGRGVEAFSCRASSKQTRPSGSGPQHPCQLRLFQGPQRPSSPEEISPLPLHHAMYCISSFRNLRCLYRPSRQIHLSLTPLLSPPLPSLQPLRPSHSVSTGPELQLTQLFLTSMPCCYSERRSVLRGGGARIGAQEILQNRVDAHPEEEQEVETYPYGAERDTDWMTLTSISCCLS